MNFILIILIKITIQHDWLYLPIVSYYNIAFLLEAEIHNTQLFFIVDTGSSVTMLESYYKQSATFQALNTTYEQQYDAGNCSGVFGNDKLILSKSLQIDKFTMAYGTCHKMPFFDQSMGLMGLSNRFQVKHVFEDEQFHSSIFGLEFRKNQESKLYYNITNLNHKLTWHKLNADYRWMIKMIGVYTNDQDVTDMFVESAFMDSGYSCLILTKSQFAYIWENYLKQYCKIIDKSYYCDCQEKNLPNITIYLEGSKTVITPDNYLPYSYNGKLCKLCINQHNRDYVILGLPFFMSNTVLFDKQNQQIGLVDSFELIQLSKVLFYCQFIITSSLALLILFYSSLMNKTYVIIEIELQEI